MDMECSIKSKFVIEKKLTNCQQNLLFELLNIHIKYVKIKLVNILQKGNMKWRYTLLMKQKDA